MNRIVILFTLLCSITAYGQSNHEVKVARKANTIGKPLPKAVNPATPVKFSTIAECDQMLTALDKRVAAVRADKTKNAEALKNGWYTRMATERQRYVDRKDQLRKSTK